MKLTKHITLLTAAALLCAAAAGCTPASIASSVSSAPAGSVSSAPAVSQAEPTEAPTSGENILAEPLGSEVSFDLNGDGSDDTIYYDADSDDEENPVHSLQVNGTEYKDLINNGDGTDGVWINFPYTASFYIVDLDTSDAYHEIALLDLGPSDDPVTYFFRYDGTNLKCIGYITDLLNSDHCTVNGDGTVNGQLRLSLLQTWFTTATWKLQGDSLQLQSQDLYTPWYYEGSTPTVTLAQNLKVYADRDKTSAVSTWVPNDEPITFPATDNLHWVQVQRGNDTGWIYIDDFNVLDNIGETDASIVYNNLFLAD